MSHLAQVAACQVLPSAPPGDTHFFVAKTLNFGARSTASSPPRASRRRLTSSPGNRRCACFACRKPRFRKLRVAMLRCLRPAGRQGARCAESLCNALGRETSKYWWPRGRGAISACRFLAQQTPRPASPLLTPLVRWQMAPTAASTLSWTGAAPDVEWLALKACSGWGGGVSLPGKRRGRSFGSGLVL